MARPHKPLYVHPLRRSERKHLESLAKRARDARVVNRARIILLSNQRKKTAEIASLLTFSQKSACTWIRKYEADGIECLHDKPRSGRPRKTNQPYEQRLLHLVQSSPMRIDPTCPWSVWTIERLMALMEHEKFPKVSDDTVRRILHSHRYAFLRPKLDLKHKQDPKDTRRFKRQLAAVKKGWQSIPA